MRKVFKFLINARSETINEFMCFIRDQDLNIFGYLPALTFLYFIMIAVGAALTATGFWIAGIPLLVPFITVPLVIAVGSPIVYIIYQIVSIPFKALSKLFNKITNKIEKE